MNRAIRVLKNEIRKTEADLRIFSMPENYSESIINDCKIEIKELKKALDVLINYDY